jgi:hypothetical protein
VRDRGTRQELERRVVVDVGAFQHTAVPVIRVFAHADIGDDDEVGDRALQLANRALHRAPRIPRAGACLILPIRNPEQQHATDAKLRGRLRIAQHLVHRCLCDTRHRAHRLSHPLPRPHEQRKHELGW